MDNVVFMTAIYFIRLLNILPLLVANKNGVTYYQLKVPEPVYFVRKFD